MTSRVLGTEHVFPLSRENIESKKDAKKKKRAKEGEKKKEKETAEKKMSECSIAALQGDVRRSRGSSS